MRESSTFALVAAQGAYTVAMVAFHRLSALDAMFVGIENKHRHMHVGAVLMFEPGPMCREDGSVNLETISAHVEETLTHVPQYRRRLRPVPWLRHPVWVDDEHFNLDYHLRHVALPKPGSKRQLNRLAGRIFSEKLDRERPLWQIYIIEGLEGGRFALIGKVHHAMVDGIAGVEMIARLLRVTPDATVKPLQHPWTPKLGARGWSLLRAELQYRRDGIHRLAQVAKQNWRASRAGRQGSTRDTISGISTVIATGITPASSTAINPRKIGPHRRFDSCRFPLADLKFIKNRLGGKLNDVILAMCAGALRHFLIDLGDNVDLHKDFRVLMPVSTRKVAGAPGNDIALTLLRLPVHLCDEGERYQEVVEQTTHLKGESHQVEGVAFLEDLSDVTLDALIREGVRFAGMLRPFNVVITNVPGPPIDLFFLGSKLCGMAPFVPLFEQQALGIAVMSYAGVLEIGLSADWHKLPDLHLLCDDFRVAFEELQLLARSSGNTAAPPNTGDQG